jgi:hypothetical protein
VIFILTVTPERDVQIQVLENGQGVMLRIRAGCAPQAGALVGIDGSMVHV